MASKVKEAAGAVERILLPRLNSIDGKPLNLLIASSQTGPLGVCDQTLAVRAEDDGQTSTSSTSNDAIKVNLGATLSASPGKNVELGLEPGGDP
ncbi:MAG: hypothetical protein OK474_02990 [Thaumarchaeota archaeon]|nr:hypothetical protein [Nitrososphaerota archaeon]